MVPSRLLVLTSRWFFGKVYDVAILLLCASYHLFTVVCDSRVYESESSRAVPEFGSGSGRNPAFFANPADIRLRGAGFGKLSLNNTQTTFTHWSFTICEDITLDLPSPKTKMMNTVECRRHFTVISQSSESLLNSGCILFQIYIDL